jgi:hypothetical protein
VARRVTDFCDVVALAKHLRAYDETRELLRLGRQQKKRDETRGGAHMGCTLQVEVLQGLRCFWGGQARQAVHPSHEIDLRMQAT